MLLCNIYEQMILEQNQQMVLYHGLDRNFDDIEDINTGMWFATELKSPIMNHYTNRGFGYIVVKFTPKHLIIDLTNYDVDELIDAENIEDFIIDVLDNTPNFDNNREIAYRRIYFEGEVEPKYDNDSYENGYYSYSEILNWLITNILIKHRNQISGVIVNEAGYETVAVFNTDELQIMKRANS